MCAPHMRAGRAGPLLEPVSRARGSALDGGVGRPDEGRPARCPARTVKVGGGVLGVGRRSAMRVRACTDSDPELTGAAELMTRPAL